MADRHWSIYLDAADWEGETDLPASEVNGPFVEAQVARFAAARGLATEDLVFDAESGGVAVISDSRQRLHDLVLGLMDAGLLSQAEAGEGIAEVDGPIVRPSPDSVDEPPLLDGPYPQEDEGVLRAYLFAFERRRWAGMSDVELVADAAAALDAAGLSDRLSVRVVKPGLITLDGASVDDFRLGAAALGMRLDREFG